MIFVKHNFDYENPELNIKRLNYLFEKYKGNESILQSEFLEKINDAYYEYAAPLYSPGYESSLRSAFIRFFNDIPAGRDIIDVGAGTGASFRLIQDIGYAYSDYYFIEPSSHMLKRFVPTVSPLSSGSLKIYCGNLESVRLDTLRPRVFLLSAVLRAIANLDEFLKDLNAKMKPGDILFLPVEPNNESFAGQTLSTLANELHAKTIGLSARVIDGFRRRFKKSILRNTIEPHHLECSLRLLVESGVVSNSFTQRHLYALVYYQNYEWWRYLDIPVNSDEGFFTPDGIARALNATLMHFHAFNFFQFRPVSPLGKWIENELKVLYPKHCAYYTAAYIKNKYN